MPRQEKEPIQRVIHVQCSIGLNSLSIDSNLLLYLFCSKNLLIFTCVKCITKTKVKTTNFFPPFLLMDPRSRIRDPE